MADTRASSASVRRAYTKISGVLTFEKTTQGLSVRLILSKNSLNLSTNSLNLSTKSDNLSQNSLNLTSPHTPLIKKENYKRNEIDVVVDKRSAQQHQQQQIFLDIPDWPAALAYAKERNVPEFILQKWFLDRSAAGWIARNGRTIANWKADIMRYAAREWTADNAATTKTPPRLPETRARGEARAKGEAFNRPPEITPEERQHLADAQEWKKDPDYQATVEQIMKRFSRL